jgi:hypothetical protein
MPKIITARRRESVHEKALEYVKSHILFPSGILGLIFMVAGMAALAYQFIAVTYSWQTFAETVGLLLVGGLLGWLQTRYHRYILREHPGYFAGRRRLYSGRGQMRRKPDVSQHELEHRGRQWVPLAYVVGIVALLGAAAWTAIVGHTYYVAALVMPWAGFFWAKMFFWREILTYEGTKG